MVTPEVAAVAEVRISVFGTVTVTGSGGTTIGGRALGGRRARLALVALALSAGPLPADRLAAIIWPEQQPPTWQAALRGVDPVAAHQPDAGRRRWRAGGR